MVKKTRAVVAVLFLSVSTVSISRGIEKQRTPDSHDPEMNDILTVKDMLDSCITKNDRVNAERLKAHTLDRGSKYSVLLMIEFHDDLSWDKLEAMRQNAPQRWVLFQKYMNQALAWLSLSRKAENFLGGDLGKEIKEMLKKK